MRKHTFLILFAIAGVFAIGLVAKSQTPPEKNHHRVVIEFTTGEAAQWPKVIDTVANLQKSFGAENTEMEVVCHVQGLNMLVAKSDASLVQPLTEKSHDGVVFAACENSMQKLHMTKDELMPFAVTVDSGVAEIVRKEEAGWSYLKFGI